MYKNGFVLAVKDSKGYVLREQNDTVYMPFYEEYSLRVKNDNSRKCVVTITIDGKDVMDGKQLIVSPGSNVDLERFVKSLDSGRRFQYLPKGDSRLKERGVDSSVDLGFIEATFTMEKEIQIKRDNHYHHWYPYYIPSPAPTEPWPPWGRRRYGGVRCRGASGSINCTSEMAVSSALNCTSEMAVSSAFVCTSAPVGGTGEGSRSNQHFSLGSTNELENSSTTIRLRILPTGSEPALTVDNTKNKYCIHCGKKLPINASFCSKCGNVVIYREKVQE